MNSSVAARENARHSNGQFGEQSKQDPGPAAISSLAARQVPAYTIVEGDTVWVDGNPVVAKTLILSRDWTASIVDTDGRRHEIGNPNTLVFRSKTPVAPFDGIDWTDAPELDDWESDSGQIDTTVRYNPDGFGQVSAELTGVGDYRFHAAHYLEILGNFDPDEQLPDGRTKSEALDHWVTDVVMNAVDDGIRERYGWDVISGDEPDSDVRPLVWATNTESGELDEETAAALLAPAQAQFVNESDPGTFNCSYPYHGWIDAAVKQRQAEGEPGLPW